MTAINEFGDDLGWMCLVNLAIHLAEKGHIANTQCCRRTVQLRRANAAQFVRPRIG